MIITIGREYGSGGREIGRIVAQKLGVPFYDKEVLTRAAQESGLCEELFERHDEKASVGGMISGSHSMHMGTASVGLQMPLNQRVFLAQFDAISKIALEGDCVIVGRCADFILRDHPHALHIFVHADNEHRAARILERYGETNQPMSKRLQEKDSKRKVYYKHYTNQNWGEAPNYHLCLNSGLIGVDKCVDIICDIAQMD